MKILDNVFVSQKWSLTIRDWTQGLIMAVYGAIGGQLASIALQWLKTDSWSLIDWTSLSAAGKGALIAAVSYLWKRFSQKGDIIIPNASKATVASIKDNSASIAVVSTPAQKLPPLP